MTLGGGLGGHLPSVPGGIPSPGSERSERLYKPAQGARRTVPLLGELCNDQVRHLRVALLSLEGKDAAFRFPPCDE